MRKPLVIILAILLFITFPLVMLMAFSSREPSYEGKSLSHWVRTMNASRDAAQKEHARAAIRSLGHHSIPLLLRWLREEDHISAVGRFDEVRQHVFWWLVQHKLLKNRPITSLPDNYVSHRAVAIWALPELEAADQRKAIPLLIPMLNEKKPKQTNEISDSAGAAWCVLSKMNPEAIQPLITALTNQDYYAWALSASALAQIGPDAKAAIPVVKMRLDDKDPRLRASAAYSIGKLGADPAIFIPLVIRDLDGKDWETLDFQLDILTSYKECATNALPVLAELLNKSAGSTNINDVFARNSITNAIRIIRGDPDH